MLEEAYLHNDSLEFCDKKLSLHDCNIDQIAYENDGLKLYLSGGLWITPNHEANASFVPVRTDAARVDLRVSDLDEIQMKLFSKGFLNRERTVTWSLDGLIRAVNGGDTLEILEIYWASTEMLWQCMLHSKKNRRFYMAYLRIPATEATFRWNRLRSDLTW